VSHTAAKRVFAEMRRSGQPPAQIAEREGLLQEGSDDAITLWVDEVMAEHPEETRRFLSGERKLLGVLVGAVMKKSKGRADPKRVNQLLASRASG
jgi:aspartyl-tRNA(Asn)/glutamyl-tRNA(Gln) amidotransferase subunit B